MKLARGDFRFSFRFLCNWCSDQPHGSVVSPSHQPGGGSTGGSGGGGGGAPVNFRSIEELSRSDRQPDMEVDPHNPQMAKVISLIRSSRKNATFSGRLSPQSVRGLSPTPSPINRYIYIVQSAFSYIIYCMCKFTLTNIVSYTINAYVYSTHVTLSYNATCI